MINRLNGTRPITTLILTHPSDRVPLERPGNSRVCAGAWHRPPVECDYKLWLYTKSGFVPGGLAMEPRAQAKFSDSGRLDEEDNTILEEGFIAPGHTHYILGGGFMDLCLSNTFDSLVRLTARRREKVVVFGLLPIVYSANVLDPSEYLTGKNAYSSFLARAVNNGDLSGYRLYFDGRLIGGRGNDRLCLSWHSRVEELVSSPLWG